MALVLFCYRYVIPDIKEKPIASEHNYSQLDKEGLSIILESESLPYSLTTDLFNTLLVKIAQFHTWLQSDFKDEHLP